MTRKQNITRAFQDYLDARCRYREEYERCRTTAWKEYEESKKIFRALEEMTAARKSIIELYGPQFFEALDMVRAYTQDFILVCEKQRLPLPSQISPLCSAMTRGIKE